MAKIEYATLSRCALCGKTFKGPTWLFHHLTSEHRVYGIAAKQQYMQQVPNPAYKGPV